MSWEGPSWTGAVWEHGEEEEEQGGRGKERREEPSPVVGCAGVSRPKASTRLSEGWASS